MTSVVEQLPVAHHDAELDTVFKAALLCARNGLSVYPLHRVVGGKCTCREEHPERFDGVHTACGRSHISATCDEQIITGWWMQQPELNFAVSMSKNVANTEYKVRIVEVAGSLPEAEEELAKWAAALAIDLNFEMVVATPHGKHQFYLYVPCGLEIQAKVADGITVFQHDAVVPGPGSVDFGGQYVSIVAFREDFSFATATAARNMNGAEVLIVPAVSADDDAGLEKQVGGIVADITHDSDIEPLSGTDSVAGIVADNDSDRTCSSTVNEKMARANPPSEHSAVAEKAQARLKKIYEAAASYLQCGWQLCAIENGSKKPYAERWQNNPLKLENVGYHGLGLIHALSDTCAIDVDDILAAEALFANEGIDLVDLLQADDAVQIRSGRANRAKLIYRLPPGVTAPGLKQFKHRDGAMILEFRGASANGSGCQDVLPPSVHPDTQQEYEWAGAGDYRNLPTLPEKILLMWQRECHRMARFSTRRQTLWRKVAATIRCSVSPVISSGKT